MLHLPKDGAEPFRKAVQEMADELRPVSRGGSLKQTLSDAKTGATEVVAEEVKAAEDAFLREIGVI